MTAEPGSLEETLTLVRAAQGGDRGATDSLFQRYYPFVLQVVALRMGQPASVLHEREDLVQEAFLDAFRGLERFEHQGEGSFRNWLATIVTARVRDGWRRAGALKRGAGQARARGDAGSSLLSASFLADGGATPSEDAAARELEASIEGALLTLPDRERSAVELRRLCGLEYSDIADELELPSEGAARALVARGLARLAERIPG
jgi:RNA polymerase sigma-70 factor (ECF subfamily)